MTCNEANCMFHEHETEVAPNSFHRLEHCHEMGDGPHHHFYELTCDGDVEDCEEGCEDVCQFEAEEEA